MFFFHNIAQIVLERRIQTQIYDQTNQFFGRFLFLVARIIALEGSQSHKRFTIALQRLRTHHWLIVTDENIALRTVPFFVLLH